MPPKLSMLRARLYALSAAVLFSTGGAAIKTDAFSAAQVAGLRSGIAAVALLIWTGKRLNWSWMAAAIGSIYAAVVLLFVLSTRLTTAASAIFMQSTAPIYLLVLGPAVLGERVRRQDWVYVAAMGGGIALCFVGRPDATATAPDPRTGNLLAALAGVAWALTLLSLRHAEREPARRSQGLTIVVAGNLMACLATVPWLWPLPAASAVDWGTIMYLGVCQIALAYVLLTSAMQRLPALDASLLLLVEPVFNPVWTWLIRGEEPGSGTILGGAVILGATALRTLIEAGRRPSDL